MSTGLLALLDDIASVLDDVAVATRMATRQTAGVLGDDLALNAEQVSGTKPERELPVVWAVAKGSALNKAILVPGALLIGAFAHWLITPLMMFGGAFLCFEGVEKIVHAIVHREEEAEHKKDLSRALDDDSVDVVRFEKDKIKGAIRTDFVLSAEIVVISLGAVSEASIAVQALTLIAISVIATVGIYGLVAGIVKLDDLGLFWSDAKSAALRALSKALLRAAPLLMKSLSVIGIIAVFLVGGGIIAHSMERLKRWSAELESKLSAVEGVGGVLGAVGPPLFDATVGLAVGGVSLALVTGGRRAVQVLPFGSKKKA